MSIRVVLVGCGHMGYAMLRGWLTSAKLYPGEVAIVEPDPTLRARARELGTTAFVDAGSLPAALEPVIVLFAVKPQLMHEVAPAYQRFRGACFVSVAAGIRMATLERLLGQGTALIRCMPNTPVAIGKGMMVVVANSHADAESQAFVTDLLSASGQVARLEDEALMDAVTAVSGSGPAYVFHFIECLARAAEEAGLDAAMARLLAVQTVHGAASLASQSSEDPAQLRQQVTSEKGTTAAALQVLMEEDRLQVLVRQAVLAAKNRSLELGQ